MTDSTIPALPASDLAIATREARGHFVDCGAPIAATLPAWDIWHEIKVTYVGGVGGFLIDIAPLLSDATARRIDPERF